MIEPLDNDMSMISESSVNFDSNRNMIDVPNKEFH